MTGSRLYLDTAPFIYFLEKSSLYFDKIRDFFIRCKNQDIPLVTSAMTVEEYCVFPLSQHDSQAVSNFDAFLNGMHVAVVPADKDIALKAAKIRAEYKGFKALDAVHLATALSGGCSAFITNDRQLRQMREIPVFTMDNLKDLDLQGKS